MSRGLSNVPLDSPPACGHAGALVVLTVKGRGRLCGPCWRRWVRGRLDWPALAVPLLAGTDQV